MCDSDAKIQTKYGLNLAFIIFTFVSVFDWIINDPALPVKVDYVDNSNVVLKQVYNCDLQPSKLLNMSESDLLNCKNTQLVDDLGKVCIDYSTIPATQCTVELKPTGQQLYSVTSTESDFISQIITQDCEKNNAVKCTDLKVGMTLYAEYYPIQKDNKLVIYGETNHSVACACIVYTILVCAFLMMHLLIEILIN